MSDPTISDDRHAASVAFHRDADQDSPLSETLGALPSYVTRGLLYIIISFVLVTLLWAGLNEVNVIVAVPSEVIPEGKLKVIDSAFGGTVREIDVREGEAVRAGQVLIVLESETVSQHLSELKVREAELAMALEKRDHTTPGRIAALREKIASEKEQFDRRQKIHKQNLQRNNELARRLKLEITNARGRVKLADAELEMSRRLAEKGIVAKRKLLELERIKEEAAIQVETLQSGMREAEMNEAIEIEEFNLGMQEHQTTIADLEERIFDLQTEAEEEVQRATIQFDQARDLAALNLQGVSADVVEQTSLGQGATTNIAAISAPTDGIVAEIAIRNRGESVERGETIVTLVPEGVSLVAELRIPDRDIGKVREGQPIKFKFDAFPFAEYGVLTGSVQSISPSAVEDEVGGESYYRATSRLNQEYFRVAGREARLLPGMLATAEISTERKSLLSLILKPFAELREPREAER